MADSEKNYNHDLIQHRLNEQNKVLEKVITQLESLTIDFAILKTKVIVITTVSSLLISAVITTIFKFIGGVK